MATAVRNGKSRKSSNTGLAGQHHILDLYEASVQEPEADVEFFTSYFKKLRKRVPLKLREDFRKINLRILNYVKVKLHTIQILILKVV